MPEWKMPAGYTCAAVASGIKKKGKPDLGLILSEGPAACAGVFTRNRVVAAPLELTRPRIATGRCQAILVNSGNANACTGQAGLQVARDCSALVSKSLGIDDALVAIASTGVIGVPLPFEPFSAAFPELASAQSDAAIEQVATAMMTTDSFLKLSAAEMSGKSGSCRILGLAKGAGMIHPNMATMLGFILTDAALEPEQLQRLLRPAVDNSFNAITVDGDTSTNDMVLLLANGAGGLRIEPGSSVEEDFAGKLQQVLLDLAKMIVRDGEGATKLVEIRVEGATDAGEAKTVARAIATSSLCKTAFFGEDANWGRIIAAAGYSGVAVDPETIDIFFDDVQVAHAGMSVGPQAEEPATAVLKKPEFCVRLTLGQGDARASYYTSDLTYDYVKINADYRT